MTIKATYKNEYFDVENTENTEILQAMLLYLNSLGDPVFPISEEEWSEPQNDISKVDTKEVRAVFNQELDNLKNELLENCSTLVDDFGLEVWIE